MISIFSVLLSVAALAAPVPTASDLLAASKPSDWRAVAPENTLYMDMPAGRVIIELSPEYAPKHYNNIKTLAHEKYWDGLAVVRVQDNYVVQWADPNAEKPEQRRKFSVGPKLDAEFDRPTEAKIPFQKLRDSDVYAKEVGFSNGFAAGRDPKTKATWLLHCYGAVGVGRDDAVDSGNGAELYAVIGQAPRHLDRNVTVVGRVLQGMEFLSSLPRGHGALGFYEKPEQNVPIRSIHLASDVPASERTELEVLRTDTDLFAKLIAARSVRTESWFHYKAGHIDICNMPVPVRPKK